MDAIIERQMNMVYRIACAQTRHTADAEDVTQDVFGKYIKSRPHFESLEHEKAWFVRVTMNTCRDLFKSAWKKRVELSDEPLNGGVINSIGDVHAALLSLDDKSRIIIYLHYYESADTDTIAQLLGISSSAVRKRLERARARLRDILGDVS